MIPYYHIDDLDKLVYMHILDNQILMMFKCIQCPHGFASKEYLEYHIKVAHEPQQVQSNEELNHPVNNHERDVKLPVRSIPLYK